MTAILMVVMDLAVVVTLVVPLLPVMEEVRGATCSLPHLTEGRTACPPGRS